MTETQKFPMNDPKKYEVSDSMLKGEEDIELDPGMNVDDILNEDDDFETPTLRNNKKTLPTKQEKPLIKVQSGNLFSEKTQNTKGEDQHMKFKNESGNWNTDDQKTPFGDSKNVG